MEDKDLVDESSVSANEEDLSSKEAEGENSEKKKKTKAKKKVKKVSKQRNSNAKREGVKYRATSLKNQWFRGVWFEEGVSVELCENDAKAYSKRAIHFERLEQ